MTNYPYEEKIEIEKNCNGDSRVALRAPTIEEFDHANTLHRGDVIKLAYRFCDIMKHQAAGHDWTKSAEPYRSMFYRDLCSAINGDLIFMEGQWAKGHYNKWERHHLGHGSYKDDVNLFDVVEAICDMVAAGAARSGQVYPVEFDNDMLQKAVSNTIEIMWNQVEIVEPKNDISGEEKRQVKTVDARELYGASIAGSGNRTDKCEKSHYERYYKGLGGGKEEC